MNDNIRALLGACGLVLGMVCFWFCAYKCIMCRKEQEDKRHKFTVLPMTRFPATHITPKVTYTAARSHM